MRCSVDALKCNPSSNARGAGDVQQGTGAAIVAVGFCLTPAIGRRRSARHHWRPIQPEQGRRRLRAAGHANWRRRDFAASAPSAGPARPRRKTATAFEHEIERLRSENAALKKDLLAHGLPLPGDDDARGSGGRTAIRSRSGLPDNADIDRAVAYVGQVWQRFVDAVSKAPKADAEQDLSQELVIDPRIY